MKNRMGKGTQVIQIMKALLASYIEEVKIAMARAEITLTNVAGDVISATEATIPDFMNYFQVNLMNPKVIVGIIIPDNCLFP